MKTEITSKKLKKYYKVYKVHSTEVYGLFFGRYPTYYNSGIYGWNYDVYILDTSRDIAIISGYRTCGGQALDYKKIDKLQKKYLKLKQNAARERLINNFLDNINNYVK